MAWEVGQAVQTSDNSLLLTEGTASFSVPCALYSCDEDGYLLPVTRVAFAFMFTKQTGFYITGVTEQAELPAQTD